MLVSFTTGSGAYTIQTLCRPRAPSRTAARSPSTAVGPPSSRTRCPSGVTVTSTSLGSKQLVFSCQGMPYNNTGRTALTTDQTVVISDSAGSRTVTVRASGEVVCLVTAGGSSCTY